MYSLIHLTTASPTHNSSTSRSPLRRGVLVIPLALALVLAWFALSPAAQAVDPPPDGGYPGTNTAEGDNALASLTTGFSNTANGFNALTSNTTGFFNTATGVAALFSNTTGGLNTANGSDALANNTTGVVNTATGVNALRSNTTGNDNTANGAFALESNTTGGLNTAIGWLALSSNTTGSFNTANGSAALAFTTGSSNTANGAFALNHNTTGSDNTADGVSALTSNTTGSGNIALGLSAGVNLTTGSNNIEIGNAGVAGESNHIRIGTKGTHKHVHIAGIYGSTVAGGGVEVMVDSTGHLGTVTSSARFKDEIKPMDKTSEAILALKPVTFRYKHELDPEGIAQFGLVAEQVEKVNPDLVARDDEGKPYTVRYEAVNAMLLNEFLKEHRKVEEQDRKDKQQEATIAQMKKQIEVLTRGLQKVSDQLEISKPAPQLVVSNW